MSDEDYIIYTNPIEISFIGRKYYKILVQCIIFKVKWLYVKRFVE
mgnify:CR=1 FL=1